MNPWSDTRIWNGGEFTLERGGRLAQLEIAYATAGRLAPDGRNAVLLTHGYTSSHRFAEPAADGAEGGWALLVGPGRAIDTDTLFVVAPNMLGSCYGTSGPRSTDPETGRPYGPTFPEFTVGDMVRGQKALLDALGVRHLRAVVGPSYGGFQAFQWAVTFPDFMSGIVAAVTALARPRDENVNTAADLARSFARDPGWNGGHCYPDGIKATMARLRVATLKNYGIEARLAPAYPDAAARERAIEAIAAAWAEAFDPNSLIVLRRALDFYDIAPQVGRIRAKVLYALSRTDRLFPPTLEAPTMARLREAGVDVTYTLIDSELGHAASGDDAAKWEPALRQFMARLS
ncbi:MAG: alpha/beta fold hydrolase [Rhodospirillales bacterium]|nr:alpha/beta fold hydrolase [Rhodospirillales bacterium]